MLSVRRFRCRTSHRRTKVFAETFSPSVTRPHARRTSRLQGLVRHLGLALGGRPAQALAARLLLPVSKDTFRGRVEQLPDWLSEARTGTLDSFARGLGANIEAVAAALRETWSNGQTEGQINRLKTLKRQMYGPTSTSSGLDLSTSHSYLHRN